MTNSDVTDFYKKPKGTVLFHDSLVFAVDFESVDVGTSGWKTVSDVTCSQANVVVSGSPPPSFHSYDQSTTAVEPYTEQCDENASCPDPPSDSSLVIWIILAILLIIGLSVVIFCSCKKMQSKVCAIPVQQPDPALVK